jgi:hypothetical protein
MTRVFLLSPASCSGQRARMLLRPEAAFPLAQQVRSTEGAPLGEVFALLSGLYFRGKLAYARRFADPPPGVEGALVITPTAGLVAVEARVRAATLRGWAKVDIADGGARYRAPLARDACALVERLGDDGEVVLLGSIASGKYVDLLEAVFGARLRFPRAFVGRGDMSRGGLMLRCASSGEELAYTPVSGAVRHGPRPPKLTR